MLISFAKKVNDPIASHGIKQRSWASHKIFNEMVTSTYSSLAGPFGVELVYDAAGSGQHGELQ